MKAHATLFAALACAALVAPAAALAQAYPSTKPVQIVVPYPAGGSSDVIARILTSKLSEALKQSFVVDNRAGAGTLLGTQHVANAPADGYTLLLADVPFTVNPSVVPTARYSPIKDFTPIALVGTSVQAMYGNPGRVASIADLLAKAKARPGEVSVATAGAGTTSDLLTELFQAGAGVKLLKVPYKGSSPALNDTAAGHVDGSFSTLASAAPLVNAGRIKVIAIGSPRRVASHPEVPTFEEAGVPGMNIRHWWGVLGPAGMPAGVVQQLQAEIGRAVNRPEVREQLRILSVEASTASTAEFSKVLADDVQRWDRLVKENNIKAD
ncbi:MAG: tripartite tricarboxylate transporter substrate binding protein [Comamonadaceae bacterium]|nr:MAG: tripartite tricarboxylate transporter substrate binding protein [Comamonadaceae bacterium]